MTITLFKKYKSYFMGYPRIKYSNSFGDVIITINPKQLIQFYQQKGVDNKAREISDIWLWDYATLEVTHDYIQWLFPLTKPSIYNKFVPVLEEKTINIFNQSDNLKKNLFKSFSLMINFYGFEISGPYSDFKITKSHIFNDRAKKWITPNNHNYLRISRILESCKLLGIPDASNQFLNILYTLEQQHQDQIGKASYTYWTKSLNKG